MDFLKGSRSVVAVLAIGALSGCATGGGYHAYAPDQAQPVERIVILAPANPAAYSLYNQGGAGKAFGLVGALVEGPGDAEKARTFDNLLTEAGFDFSAELTDSLKAELQSSGYEVSVVRVEREKPTAKAGQAAELNGIEADAVLDVVTQMVGYANESITDNDFRPDIRVRVELLSAEAREELYAETIMYGYSNPFMAVTELPAPRDYYFDGAEELLADTAKATEGLQKGVDTVASHIAGRLNGT